MQVDACTANFAIQEMSLGIHYNEGGEDLTSYVRNPEVWRVEEGYIKLMAGPGLGIEVDEEWVRRRAKESDAWVRYVDLLILKYSFYWVCLETRRTAPISLCGMKGLDLVSRQV